MTPTGSPLHPSIQARLDRLEARLAFLDRMVARDTLADLDRHLYACEAAHWRQVMPRIAQQGA